MFASVAFSLAVLVQTPAPQGSPQAAPRPQDDGPIVTAGPAETVDSVRLREAVAYANPLPRGVNNLWTKGGLLFTPPFQ